MVATDLLDDAQLLFERAQAHKRELNGLLGAGPGLLWNIERSTSPEGQHRAELRIDRSAQHRAKPILADVANNLVHAFDHVTAAARKAAGRPAPRNLYFPIERDDDDYAKAIEKKVAVHLDQPWIDIFAAAREMHRPYLHYLQLVRILSRESKHWELATGTAGALAVQWIPAWIAATPDRGNASGSFCRERQLHDLGSRRALSERRGSDCHKLSGRW